MWNNRGLNVICSSLDFFLWRSEALKVPLPLLWKLFLSSLCTVPHLLHVQFITVSYRLPVDHQYRLTGMTKKKNNTHSVRLMLWSKTKWKLMRLRSDFISAAQESLGSMATARDDGFHRESLYTHYIYPNQMLPVMHWGRTSLWWNSAKWWHLFLNLTARAGQDCVTRANFIFQLIRMNDFFVEMSAFISLTALAFSKHASII